MTGGENYDVLLKTYMESSLVVRSEVIMTSLLTARELFTILVGSVLYILSDKSPRVTKGCEGWCRGWGRRRM